MKLLYLILNHAAEEWNHCRESGSRSKTQFADVFGERSVGE